MALNEAWTILIPKSKILPNFLQILQILQVLKQHFISYYLTDKMCHLLFVS
jgi:hypothetical protein